MNSFNEGFIASFPLKWTIFENHVILLGTLHTLRFISCVLSIFNSYMKMHLKWWSAIEREQRLSVSVLLYSISSKWLRQFEYLILNTHECQFSNFLIALWTKQFVSILRIYFRSKFAVFLVKLLTLCLALHSQNELL